MLSSGDLAAMRSAQAEWLAGGTAVVQTNVPVSDGAGGYTDGWATVGTYGCRVAPAGGAERELGGAVRDVAAWMVTLPYDAQVGARDRIVTGGRVLEVVGVAADTTIQTAVRCACVEVR